MVVLQRCTSSSQIFDVPLYVVADCEAYREGNSDAHVASFAYCVVGSDLYTPPAEHRYRVLLDEEGDSAVGCMARGLQALLEELWPHARERSQAHPLVDDYDEEDFQFAEVCYLCGLKPCEKGLLREHCHWTGELVFKSIPVYFHNMAGFDHGPLIRAITEISSSYPHYTATLINKSAEK